MTATRPDLRAERGFSMFLVIMAMLLTSMFVAAAFAAANGDLPISGVSKDRKSTYAAAEAGLNSTSTTSSRTTTTGPSATSARRRTRPRTTRSTSSATGPSDKRRWRTIPGSTAQYTIELLHTSPYTKCETDPSKQDSVIDLTTGTFKIRVTGRPTPTSTQRRSIVAHVPAQRLPELHLLHRLRDARPAGARHRSAPATPRRPTAATSTARRAPARAATRSSSSPATRSRARCTPTTTACCVAGRRCSGATVRVDPSRSPGPAPGLRQERRCGGDTELNAVGKFTTTPSRCTMPTSNDQLADVAATAAPSTPARRSSA